MIVLIYCLMAVLAICFMAFLVISPCRTHRYMTRRYSEKLCHGTFDDFMREMQSHKWDREPLYPISFFDIDTDSEVHASIVRFDGVGMLLGPLDWGRVQKFLRKNRLPARDIPTGEDWKALIK